MKTGDHIHAAQSTNCVSFGDHMTFPVMTSLDQMLDRMLD